MIIEAVGSKITRLSFEPEEGRSNPYNIYIIRESGNGIAIDSGQEKHGEPIADYLEARNTGLSHQVFSHYHGDHILGYQRLPEARVVGSSRYDVILGLFRNLEKKDRFCPEITVEDSPRLAVGETVLEFIPLPGHTPCSIGTLIDGEYLHLGDIIINSADGEALLPLLSYEDIDRYIDSLESLKKLTNCHWLLGHGVISQSEEAKIMALEDRILYLEKLRASNGDIAFEDAVSDCRNEFLHGFWHEYNRPDGSPAGE